MYRRQCPVAGAPQRFGRQGGVRLDSDFPGDHGQGPCGIELPLRAQITALRQQGLQVAPGVDIAVHATVTKAGQVIVVMRHALTVTAIGKQFHAVGDVYGCAGHAARCVGKLLVAIREFHTDFTVHHTQLDVPGG